MGESRRSLSKDRGTPESEKKTVVTNGDAGDLVKPENNRIVKRGAGKSEPRPNRTFTETDTTIRAEKSGARPKRTSTEVKISLKRRASSDSVSKKRKLST